MKLPIESDVLRRVLAGLPEFILIVDEARVIRYINRVEPGYDRDEVIGMHATDFLFPESREILTDALDRVFAEGEVVEFDVEVRHPDGFARQELAQVRRLLPMCAWCNRIQAEEGIWEEIGTYLKRVEKTDVSHGLCPACEKKHFGRAEGA